jgi:hypothetical protein
MHGRRVTERSSWSLQGNGVQRVWNGARTLKSTPRLLQAEVTVKD